MVKRLAVAGTNGQQLPINFGVSWFGVSWDVCVQVLLSAAIIMATALPVARLVGTAGEQMQVIVREMDGAGSGPEHLVRQLGGKVNFELPVIGGFSATIPASAIDAVAAGHGISAVTPDGQVHFNSIGDSFDASSTMGSLYNTAKAIGATDLWKRGITGKGIDVAVIDTGVSPDPDFAGRLINGPDLSFDSQSGYFALRRRLRPRHPHGQHHRRARPRRSRRMTSSPTPTTLSAWRLVRAWST